MVFFIIFLAVVLYSFLYLLWQAYGDRIGIIAPFLNTINNLLFVNDDVVFVIFRGLFFISLAYVLFDFVASFLRRRAKKKKRDEELLASKTTTRSV